MIADGGAVNASAAAAPGVMLNAPLTAVVSDPDAADPKARITGIDIVKDGGKVVLEHRPAPAHSIRWKQKVEDDAAKYFFVRVMTGDPAKSTAWLAPVWTGR